MTNSALASIERHARQRPDAIAIAEVDGSRVARQLSRGELMERTASLASAIHRHVPADGTLLVCERNCIELPVTLLATWLADRVAFAVSPDLAAVELAALSDVAGVCGVVGDLTLPGDKWCLPTSAVLQQQSSTPGIDRHSGCGALLLQSSGTTGLPRIVRRDMTALNAVSDNCIDALKLCEDDRMLMAMPMHHSYGLEHGVLSCLASGAILEVHRTFDPHAVIHALQSRPVTLLPGVPFTFDLLSQHAPPKMVTSLRHAYSAGSVLPPSVIDAFAASLGLPLGQIYGATEFGSVTFNDPTKGEFDPLSVGHAMSGVDIRILNADTTGEGQVAVRATSMLTRYVDHGPPATVDGFVHSGDLGRIDGKGRLTITGRLKFIIDVGGPKVNPLEVEAVLAQHPAVHEAIVVPAPISDTVTRLRAVVTLRPGTAVDADSLRAFARERMSRHKVPRFVEIRAVLPRTATGKVLRQAVACS